MHFYAFSGLQPMMKAKNSFSLEKFYHGKMKNRIPEIVWMCSSDYGTIWWKIIFVGSLFYCAFVGRVRTGKENYDLFPCILLWLLCFFLAAGAGDFALITSLISWLSSKFKEKLKKIVPLGRETWDHGMLEALSSAMQLRLRTSLHKNFFSWGGEKGAVKELWETSTWKEDEIRHFGLSSG